MFSLNIIGPNREGVFEIAEGVTRVGRDPSCELLLNDLNVAPFHAQLERSGNQSVVIDLSSKNGVFLNGSRIPANVPFALSSGDVVYIYPFVLSYSAPQPAESAPAGTTSPTSGQGSPPGPILPSALLSAPPPPPDTSGEIPPGLSNHSVRLLNYLPGIYQSDFVSRFLAMFEAILLPVEWNITNFDLYLSPDTAPTTFLPWLASWFDITFDATWTETQQRLFLQEASELFAMRGTKWALRRVLEIYTGRAPEIIDQANDLPPFAFRIKFPFRERDFNRALLERIIEADKPAHTTYQLEFARRLDFGVVWSKLS